jgi:hypothetical protein
MGTARGTGITGSLGNYIVVIPTGLVIITTASGVSGPVRHTDRAMPTIPESTKSSITLRLLTHAEAHWPQLATLEVTYRGSFAYLTGILGNGDRIRLCRLRYGGSAHSLGFAIYSATHEGYHEAALLSGFTTGSPQDALDTACTIHLANTDQ